MADEGNELEGGQEDAAEAKPDPIEEVAKEIGWNPDYDGDNAISAREFIVKSKEIQATQRKHSKALENKVEYLVEGVEAMKKHNERVYKAEIEAAKREIESLKKERREAIADADPDLVEEIDGKIEAANSRVKDPPPTTNAPESDPEYEEWLEANPWFGEDKERTDYANKLGLLYKEDPATRALPYKRFLKKVEDAVKAEFPDKSKKEPPPTPSGVEAPGNKGRRSGKTLTVADLTSEEQESMRRQIRLGVYENEKEFIKEYQKFGNL